MQRNLLYIKINFSVQSLAKLKTWKCRELHNLIFVWYHAENETPWTLPVVDEIASGKWMCHSKNEFLVDSHIQDMAENGADFGEKTIYYVFKNFSIFLPK
jgi:lipopolysaccharide biosynthesis glycosyltransferase